MYGTGTSGPSGQWDNFTAVTTDPCAHPSHTWTARPSWRMSNTITARSTASSEQKHHLCIDTVPSLPQKGAKRWLSFFIPSTPHTLLHFTVSGTIKFWKHMYLKTSIEIIAITRGFSLLNVLLTYVKALVCSFSNLWGKIFCKCNWLNEHKKSVKFCFINGKSWYLFHAFRHCSRYAMGKTTSISSKQRQFSLSKLHTYAIVLSLPFSPPCFPETKS